jgi:hypothetical protein
MFYEYIPVIMLVTFLGIMGYAFCVALPFNSFNPLDAVRSPVSFKEFKIIVDSILSDPGLTYDG